jgi:hypothetical protein
MAGENSLVTQYYPDDFQVVVYNNATASPHDPSLLLYADRDLYIDEIVVGVHVLNTTDGLITLKVTRDIGTTTPTGNTLCTIDIDSGGNMTVGDTLVITTEGVVRTNSSGVVQTATVPVTALSNTENKIPQGYWLVADLSGTWTNGRASIMTRFRSRPK